MKGKIVRLFQDVNLANSHLGLTDMAKRAGYNPATMDDNSFLIFINRAQTMVKVLTTSNVLAFYRSPKGRLTMDAIQNIPAAFMSNQQFEMTKAIEMALEKMLERKRERHLYVASRKYSRENRASA